MISVCPLAARSYAVVTSVCPLVARWYLILGGPRQRPVNLIAAGPVLVPGGWGPWAWDPGLGACGLCLEPVAWSLWSEACGLWRAACDLGPLEPSLEPVAWGLAPVARGLAAG